MAITVKRHRFPAQIDETGTQSRFMERVFVEGIEITPGSEGDVLFDAKAAIVDEVGATFGNYWLQQITLESTGMDNAVALLRWGIDGFGGTPSTAVITESTLLTGRTVNYIPGIGKAFRIASVGGVPADVGTAEILLPHRLVQVNVLTAGELPEDQGEKVGKVNETEWRGLPKGYWLVSDHTTNVSKYTGYYSRRLAAVSRVVEDWSLRFFFRNPDGTYAQVLDATYTAVNALDYAYGEIYDTAESGISRHGPYPLTDFEEFFGF